MPPSRETLIRLHTSSAAGVFRFLRSMGLDEAAAQDVLQEVFVKLARDASGSLAAAVSEQAWLFRVARNAALDWLRRGRVRDQAAQQLVDLMDAFVLPEDPDAAGMQREIAAGLADLPEEQRSVVQLHLWQGLTFREIGEIQQVSTPTATSRYRYGLQSLRAALQPLYSELSHESPL
jgi:RNA polymerase sigma-70 factor, ECF subfamily